MRRCLIVLSVLLPIVVLMSACGDGEEVGATTEAAQTTPAPGSTDAPATSSAPTTTAASGTTQLGAEAACLEDRGIWLVPSQGQARCHRALDPGLAGLVVAVVDVAADDPDGGLLVWSGPGEGNLPREDLYVTVGVLPPDATDVVASGHVTEDRWWYVSWQDVEGWVYARFLGRDGQPVVPPTVPPSACEEATEYWALIEAMEAAGEATLNVLSDVYLDGDDAPDSVASYLVRDEYGDAWALTARLGEEYTATLFFGDVWGSTHGEDPDEVGPVAVEAAVTLGDPEQVLLAQIRRSLIGPVYGLFVVEECELVSLALPDGTIPELVVGGGLHHAEGLTCGPGPLVTRIRFSFEEECPEGLASCGTVAYTATEYRVERFPAGLTEGSETTGSITGEEAVAMLGDGCFPE